MVPDSASIARKRYRMRRTLRMAALVLFVVFLVGSATAFVSTVANLLFWPGRSVSFGDMLRPMSYFSGFLVGTAFLLVAEKRLIAWLLPFPDTGCPRCAYRLDASPGPRCPECGLPLSPDFAEPAA